MEESLQEVLSRVLKDHPERIQIIADEALVSVPSVERWSRGVNLPRTVMRVGIINYLNERWPK